MKNIMLKWMVLLCVGVLTLVSCRKDDPAPPPPTPTPAMKASESSLVLELYQTKMVTLTNAPAGISVEPLDGIATDVSGTTIKITLNKPLTSAVSLKIKSGNQVVTLTISMKVLRMITAPYGVFRGENPIFEVKYSTKKINPQTRKLDYFVISDQKVRPVSSQARAFKLSALSVSGSQASFKVQTFGTAMPEFSAPQEQTLSGQVLFSTPEKVQVRAKVKDNVVYDFVFPNQ